ncbi:MAG TPA: winged helix-turn-helix domain-containing protein, partial [Candidatus Baltobacteraceae bacterium]|nr:winged helix-turn-helix domain-containing protein [Candidatus Baltobacteraceae bacterium]
MSFPTQKEIEIPLLHVLEKLGGEAKPQQIYTNVAKFFPQLTKDDKEERLPSSPSTFKWRNLVQWTRQNLVNTGEIDGSTVGLWKITEKGRQRLSEMRDSLPMNTNIETELPLNGDEFYTDDTNQVPPSDIVTFNELRSC